MSTSLTHLGYSQVLADALDGGNEKVVADDGQKGEEVDGAQEMQNDCSLHTLILCKVMITGWIRITLRGGGGQENGIRVNRSSGRSSMELLSTHSSSPPTSFSS